MKPPKPRKKQRYPEIYFCYGSPINKIDDQLIILHPSSAMYEYYLYDEMWAKYFTYTRFTTIRKIFIKNWTFIGEIKP